VQNKANAQKTIHKKYIVLFIKMCAMLDNFNIIAKGTIQSLDLKVLDEKKLQDQLK